MSAQSQISEVIEWLGRRVNLTVGTREELRQKLTSNFAPPSQASLSFEDQEALKGQSEAILKLLKSRRSQGAMNFELAEIALKYTSRVSDLRKAGWRIDCFKESGRTTRYVLSATDW